MRLRPCKYIFGPVPSRRLGRSLGVDLVPFKTCTYDCVYCQLGCTTVRTLERKEYVPIGEVFAELDRKLAEGDSPDYVTLAGSGEPTLHSRLGELVAGIKQWTRIPLAVLTNGSLLWDAAVRRGLAEADVVIPSLDAGDERLFRYVNRPHPDLPFGRMIEGLREFRKEFKHQIWLEVFLLGGVTGIEAEVAKIARLTAEISPDRVQLNTVARPPAESFALPVPKEQMERFAAMFGVPAEVVADYHGPEANVVAAVRSDSILGLLRRHPCTAAEIAGGLGLHTNEVLKCLAILMRDGSVASQMVSGNLCYRVPADCKGSLAH